VAGSSGGYEGKVAIALIVPPRPRWYKASCKLLLITNGQPAISLCAMGTRVRQARRLVTLIGVVSIVFQRSSFSPRQCPKRPRAVSWTTRRTGQKQCPC
jgi:hypothetical protein